MVAGLIGVVSLGCFYAALAGGTMGVVAPIAATGAVVPVAVGIAQGESPTVVQVAGIAVADPRGRPRLGSGAVTGRRRTRATGDRSSWPAWPRSASAPRSVLVAEGGEHSVVMTITTMRAVNAVVATLVITLFVRKAAAPDEEADLPTLVGDRRDRRRRQRPVRDRRRTCRSSA